MNNLKTLSYFFLIYEIYNWTCYTTFIFIYTNSNNFNRLEINKKFEVKPLDIIGKYKGDRFLIIYSFILGTHFVCWFFKPGGRYAYLAFILTFI